MQLTRPYRIAAAAISIAVVMFLIWYFSTVVIYILASAVLAIMGKPLVHALEKPALKGHHLPRWMAALITLTAIMALIGGLVATIFPVIVDKLQLLAGQNAADVTEMLRQPIASFEQLINEQFPNSHFSIQQALSEKIAPLMKSEFISNSVGMVANWAIDICMAIFCIAFITFFFLKDENMFNSWIVTLFPQKYEQSVSRAMSSITSLLIRYFVGISIESFIKLICIAVPAYFIGFDLPTAVIIGAIAAVLNVIPYVGPIIGGIAGFAIASITPIAGAELQTTLFYLLVTFVAFQLVDNVLLQPYIYASSVKAHPLEIFIVILMAGYIAGITGMLLAIPAYTVLRVFAKEFFSNLNVVKKLTTNI